MGTLGRTALSLTALALVSSTVAACGGSSPSDAAASGTVKLTMLTGFTGPDRPAYDALIKEFNSSHPKIQVTMDA